MRKVLIQMISIALIVMFLFPIFPSLSYADSPLTSTDFYSVYNDIDTVKSAAQSGKVDQSIANYLLSKDNGIDKKAAVINALGWYPEGKTNANDFCKFAYGKELGSVDLNTLSGEELFCIGYMTSLDDYLHPEKAVPIMKAAKAKIKDSLTISLLTALVDAQVQVHKGNWYLVWKMTNDVLEDKTLKQDLKKEAVEIIVKYMILYKDEFGVEPNLTYLNVGETATAKIIGGVSPYKIKDIKALIADWDSPNYVSPKLPTDIIYNDNAEASVKIDGSNLIYTGVQPGVVNVQLCDSNNNFISIVLIVRKQNVLFKDALVLKIGSNISLVNGYQTLIDSQNSQLSPIVENGRTLVPIRFISEKMGAKVEWDGSTSTAIITYGNNISKISVGSNQVQVNDKVLQIDVPAKMVDNRLFIPIRALCENVLNQKINYKENIIVIGSSENVTKIDNDVSAFEELVNDFTVEPSEKVKEIENEAKKLSDIMNNLK